jgi:23S rRNA pseudouridine1911/1915/1917 synthase
MECALEYTLIAAKGGRAVVLINLITGKKHQIRAQLSSLHMPIAGDIKYGAPSALPGGAIALHSTFIRITHPVKKEPVEIYSPPPEAILSHLPPGFDLRECIRQRISPYSGG